MTKSEWFKLIKDLDLPEESYAVFGSGPMFVHAIRKWEDCDDIDIVVNAEGWEFIKEKYGIESTYNEDWDCNNIALMIDGETQKPLIEIWNGWGPIKYDVELLIERADYFDDIAFVSLADMIMWKVLQNREKDQRHLEMVREYLLKN